MIQHNARFEELAIAPIKQVDVTVVRRSIDEEGDATDDPTVMWNSGDILMEVSLDAVGEMLGSSTKKSTVKLLGIVDTARVGDILQVRAGLYDTVASAWNTVSLGHFVIDSIDYDYEARSTTIVMYDHMWRAANLLYDESVSVDLLQFPMTVQAMAEIVCEVLNIKLDSNFSALPNSQYEIQEDLYSNISGTTLQNVISEIAGATGTTARITDLTLEFVPYEVSDENLNSNELKTLKIGETYGPVTSVVLGRLPQNDNIAIVATSPAEGTITSVDTSSNLFTLADHSMADGNMIRFTSTGTLPSPLDADTNYYVFTNGQANTFAVATTYDDAVNGVNLVDLTSSGSGVLSIARLQTREIAINNNEILDDEREILLPPLYNALSGIDWTEVEAETVGLGWHQVADVINFTQGGLTVRAFLSEVHLTLIGSIKEQLISIVPDTASINYAAAGGIQKTIYNTEIKVDKQAQEITSVVSRQDTIEEEVNNQFTEIHQDVDDVLITIQRAGGGNLLYNSVGFAKETYRDNDDMSYDKLLYWTYPDPYSITANGRATSYSSSESQAAGGISGQVIELSGSDMFIAQRVTVGAGVPMTFALAAKNVVGTGSALVTIGNDIDRWKMEIDDLQTYNWEEFKSVTPVDALGDPLALDEFGDPVTVETFESSMPWLDVKIQVTNAQRMQLTDIRLMYGSTTQGWVQANGEILSANVQFTTEGVRVFDSAHDTETRMTYNEFSTRRKSDNAILFEADDLGVTTNNLAIKGRTSYIREDQVIVKQITVGTDNPKSGLAFIKVAE